MRVIGLSAVLCLVILLPMGSARTAPKTCDELFAAAEEDWVTGRFQDGDKELAAAKQICPDRPELYWRMARNEYDTIEMIPRDKKPGKDELLKRYEDVQALADKCIALDPNDGECWLWKGVAMGRIGSTQGVLKTIFEVDDLEAVLLKALSLKPTYRSRNGAASSCADVNSMLGIFYRVLPEWTCAFPFKTIIGTCGDLDKAIEYQRKAVSIEPGRIEYHKELGIALICRGQRRDSDKDLAEGKKELNDLQSLPEIKNTDKIDKDHARMILADPSLACGYSRDAQQEQDKEKYMEMMDQEKQPKRR